jgi:F-box protein 20
LQPQTPAAGHIPNNGSSPSSNSATACGDPQEKMLSVSGKKKCSHCAEELGKFLRSAFYVRSLFFSFDVYKCTQNSHTVKS